MAEEADTSAARDDPVGRAQIEIEVAVLAQEDSGRPRRVSVSGEAKWDAAMMPGHDARPSGQAAAGP